MLRYGGKSGTLYLSGGDDTLGLFKLLWVLFDTGYPCSGEAHEHGF